MNKTKDEDNDDIHKIIITNGVSVPYDKNETASSIKVINHSIDSQLLIKACNTNHIIICTTDYTKKKKKVTFKANFVDIVLIENIRSAYPSILHKNRHIKEDEQDENLISNSKIHKEFKNKSTGCCKII